MTTFAHILRESDKIANMASMFSNNFLVQFEASHPAPAIAIPATDAQQGEQKIPAVKPNGVTR
jgi:hypothetical protein